MTTTDATLPRSSLDHLHRRLGATFVTVAGAEVAAGYGDPAAERRALLESAGLLDRSWLDRLEMTGEDRRRFLNGQVTCEVKELAAGALVYGFFTSRQGKVQADVTILASEDRFWLELPVGRGAPIREHLEKYALLDRVEVGPLEETVPVAVAGPRAVEILTALGAAPPQEDGRHLERDLLGGRVLIDRRPLFGLPACTLWLGAGDAAERVEALLETGAGEGLAAVGFEALETVRVERGAPRFGADFGPEHFPQETGLEERAVSYTKGCYLGQEVVARIHYRGGVQRLLRGLVFDTHEPPAAGTVLAHEGRPAGAVGTAVRSPELGIVGLAILHQRAAEPGTTLELEAGGHAEVHALPWE